MAKIAFDCKLMQPGCVLLQAAMGADPTVAQGFNPDSWLLFPTPDLKLYDITPEQLNQLQCRINHGEVQRP